MLIRSIALAVALFIPANLPVPEHVTVIREVAPVLPHLTVINWNPAPVTWLKKSVAQVPVAPAVVADIIPVIIPRAKPRMSISAPSNEVEKINTGKCRKGEKQWRTLKGGHRKYRLRRTC